MTLDESKRISELDLVEAIRKLPILPCDHSGEK